MNKYKNDIFIEDDDWTEEDFDDDCPICQAMKGGDNTPEALYLATKEVQRQGKGLVWIDPEYEKEMKKRLKNKQ